MLATGIGLMVSVTFIALPLHPGVDGVITYVTVCIVLPVLLYISPIWVPIPFAPGLFAVQL